MKRPRVRLLEFFILKNMFLVIPESGGVPLLKRAE